MMYERLSNVLERQRKYRVFDVLAAVVLAVGLGLAALTVAFQMGEVETSPVVAPQVTELDDSSPTSYTARLLADEPDQTAR